jgi:hypothetical protein
MDSNIAWGTIRGNINISAKDSVGHYERKMYDK